MSLALWLVACLLMTLNVAAVAIGCSHLTARLTRGRRSSAQPIIKAEATAATHAAKIAA